MTIVVFTLAGNIKHDNVINYTTNDDYIIINKVNEKITYFKHNIIGFTVLTGKTIISG